MTSWKEKWIYSEERWEAAEWYYKIFLYTVQRWFLKSRT